jgi:hypothetical protein
MAEASRSESAKRKAAGALRSEAEMTDIEGVQGAEILADKTPPIEANLVADNVEWAKLLLRTCALEEERVHEKGRRKDLEDDPEKSSNLRG